jgi:hypothetical protein
MCVHVGSQRITSGIFRKAVIVVESDPFGVLSFFLSFSLIGCGPIQMASAQVLSPSGHSQVEVEFPSVPCPQDDCGICCLFVCLSFSCLWRCSREGLQLEWG